MRVRALVAAAMLVLPASSFVSGAHAEILITVSKSDQRIAVNVDGAERYRWAVSTGRRGYSTPSGEFRPVRFERDWYSRKYDWAPMPNSVFFYKGYAMHGTVEERSLGRAASHGCVRLSRDNAATLFALLRERSKSGTRIVVTNASLVPSVTSPFMSEGDKPQEQPRSLAAEAQPKEPVAKAPPAKELQAKSDQPKDEPKIAAKPVRLAATGPVELPAHLDDKPPQKTKPVAEQAPRSRMASNGSFTAAGDDAAVLRGRDAWLRSLDRRYGIAR